MSPEQVEGKKLDGRSDVSVAGVILYECLTGRRPIEPDPEAESEEIGFRNRLICVGTSAFLGRPTGRRAEGARFHPPA